MTTGTNPRNSYTHTSLPSGVAHVGVGPDLSPSYRNSETSSKQLSLERQVCSAPEGFSVQSWQTWSMTQKLLLRKIKLKIKKKKRHHNPKGLNNSQNWVGNRKPPAKALAPWDNPGPELVHRIKLCCSLILPALILALCKWQPSIPGQGHVHATATMCLREYRPQV